MAVNDGQAANSLQELLERYPTIQFIDAMLIDICGRARGKRLPVEEARKLDGGAVQFPRSTYFLDATGDSLNPAGLGFSDGDPDQDAIVVPGTYAPRYFAEGEDPTFGQVMVGFENIPDQDGIVSNPRNVLEHVTDQLTARGLTPVTAFELEFYLVERTREVDGKPRPVVSPTKGNSGSDLSVFDLRTLDDFAGFVADIDRMANAQGLPATVATAEIAPGQFEINLKHSMAPLRAADDSILLRQLISSVAVAHGWEATFMPKPFLDAAGSGMHLHISMLDDNGQNIFNDNSETGSDPFRHALGGLQQLMPESMAFFASSINAYRRFAPDIFVPLSACWGLNNRAAALRVPAGPAEARRVEHRVPAADANPYLVFAAILAGMLHGMDSKIDPGQPVQGSNGNDQGLRLARSFEEALTILEGQTALASYLPDRYPALYAATKRAELVKFAKVISHQEYDWYL